MKKLSVVIIAFNEEENFGKCLDSVKTVADEILLVDSHSTDKTAEIATAKGARVIEHKFEGHIEQKNWARLQAENQWVLSLDADEAVSHELLDELKAWKNRDNKDEELVPAYSMNRLNFYCGKPIKTCGMYPDTKVRLWDRTLGSWQGTNPHDKFVLNGAERSMFMKGDILHNTWPTKQAFLKQIDKFATISAQHLKDKSTIYLIVKMIFSPPFKFIRNYFFNLGFTEGSTGWVICYHQSREVFLKYFRAIRFKYNLPQRH